MSVISEIKTVLKNRIQALDSVDTVYGYEHPSPTGYPAVYIVPATLDGEFVSSTENRRAFNFNVTAIFPTGQNIPKDGSEDALDKAEGILYTVFDQIVNDIDSNSYRADFADIGGTTSEYLFTTPADSEWGYVQVDGGMARALQITLSVQVDYTARTS